MSLTIEELQKRIDESQKDTICGVTSLLQLMFHQISLIAAERDIYLAERNSLQKRCQADLPPLPPSPIPTMDLHPSRLKQINPALCMARKVDIEKPLVGTRPGDRGANGMVWPELQCAKKPIKGEPLCRTCKKKNTILQANPERILRGWYGRLDEPLYIRAGVVGCGHFQKKYPNGLFTETETYMEPLTI